MLSVLITDRRTFGRRSEVAVHQVYEGTRDLDNAIYNAERDGFDLIVLYVALNSSEFTNVADEVTTALPDAFVKFGHRTVSKAKLALVRG